MFGIAHIRPSVSPRRTWPRADADAPRLGPPLPAVSSDEMSMVLQSCGARVVARTDHGQLFAVHRRLVFLPHSPAVAPNDLYDILRTAWIPAARLGEMLASVRSPTQPPAAPDVNGSRE
jgi:hypothetical protein